MPLSSKFEELLSSSFAFRSSRRRSAPDWTRRRSSRRAAVLLVAATVSLLAPGAFAEATRPDVVLIVADDMGMSDLGCYGGEIETPALDRLAAGGLRFTRFYSNNMCVPTRASLLTGLYHERAMDGFHLSDRYVTLAELLAGAGYSTNISGKWHLAQKSDFRHSPARRGFQRFYGTMVGACSYFQPATLRRDDENVTRDAEHADYYYTDGITRDAVRMIRETPREQPLFLYVAYTAPHWPLHAPAEDIERYRGRYAAGWDAIRQRRFERMKELGVVPEDARLPPRDPKVPAWEDEPHRSWQERRMEVYAAQVDRMDSGIGRIVDALAAAGRLDGTIVFFLADNGPCGTELTADLELDYLPARTRAGQLAVSGNRPDVLPGPEHVYQSYGAGWAGVSATPFRLYKRYCHEGGVHTPLIVHWPEGLGTEKGALTNEVGHVMDILPTVLELAGAEFPAYPLDGRSLAPILRGGSREPDETLFWEHAEGAAVRHGAWKLVVAERTGWWTLRDAWDLLREGKRGVWELYVIEEDPTESFDLRRTMPQRAAELRRAWEVWKAGLEATD
jgi:arylsulfatase